VQVVQGTCFVLQTGTVRQVVQGTLQVLISGTIRVQQICFEMVRGQQTWRQTQRPLGVGQHSPGAAQAGASQAGAAHSGAAQLAGAAQVIGTQGSQGIHSRTVFISLMVSQTVFVSVTGLQTV
jgi:hypothetical protein